MKNLDIRFEFKLEDMWVGVFWKKSYDTQQFLLVLDIWICFIPCFPLHITKKTDALE